MISETETQEFTNVLERFGAKKNGSGYVALCPAHADKNPSLSIDLKNGKILLKCFSGCTTESVCEAVGLKMSDLFIEQVPEKKIVSEYNYTDEKGRTLYQVVRFEPKDFRQRKPDGKDEWVWNINGVRRVLYRLPEVLAATDILIVEGEKDCEKARELGFVATTNSGGAGKWRPEYGVSLAGRNVVIIADNDEPGKKHALEVATALWLTAKIKLIEKLPSLFDAKDLTEWVAEGNGADDLMFLIAGTPEWNPDEPTVSVSASDAKPEAAGVEVSENKGTDILLTTVTADKIEPRRIRWLWPGYFAVKLNTAVGDPGEGKGLLTCYMAARVTTGTDWFTEKNELPPSEVLMMSNEDDFDDTLVPRLMAAGADLSKVHLLQMQPILDGKGGTVGEREFQLDTDMPRLEAFLSANPQTRLVVVDPVINFTGDTKMMDDKSVRRVLMPLKKLAEKYKLAVVAVMHLNKKADLKYVYRVAGALGLIGVARMNWILQKLPPNAETGETNDDFEMQKIKGNIVKRTQQGLVYQIEDATVEIEGQPTTVPRLRFTGYAEKTLDQMPQPGAESPGRGRPSRKLPAATEWLAEFLADGPRERSYVFKVGKEEGFSNSVIDRAREVLEVETSNSEKTKKGLDGKNYPVRMLRLQPPGDAPEDTDSMF